MKKLIALALTAALAVVFISAAGAGSTYGTIEPLGNCLQNLNTVFAKPAYFAGVNSLWTRHYTKATALQAGEYNAFAGLQGRQVFDSVLWYAHQDYPADGSYNIVYAWRNVYLGQERMVIEVRNASKPGVFFVLPMRVSDGHGVDCGFYEVSQNDFWAAMYGFAPKSSR